MKGDDRELGVMVEGRGNLRPPLSTHIHLLFTTTFVLDSQMTDIELILNSFSAFPVLFLLYFRYEKSFTD